MAQGRTGILKKVPGQPFLIAGPCSVESREQLERVAPALKACGVSVLRGGVWKPRTRPQSFRGIGEAALEWLVGVAREQELKSATEVANALHVEAALHAGVDVLWIGARTTVSPFAVQEIADALKESKVPVLIKNPVTPDLELWIGAVERVLAAGITDLAAVHRGFVHYGRTAYRNEPHWDLPMEFKRRMPDIPLYCDPSHIGGQAARIGPIAQKALDLAFDGLMIEVHPDPAKALSDAEQQISPEEFRKISEGWVVRQSDSSDPLYQNHLQELRGRIDQLDHELLETLMERFKRVTQIGAYKAENNIAVYQPERWAQIVQSREEWARELGISPEMILEILRSIHKQSVLEQTRILELQKRSKPA